MTSELADKHWTRGSELHDQGSIDDAVAEWLESLRHDPENASVHYNLGVAYSEQGREAEAIAHWLEATRLDPDEWASLFSLGYAYLKKAKQEKSRAYYISARTACRQALSIPEHESNCDAYLLRYIGCAEWQLGRKRAAIETLKAAIQRDPKDRWTYDGLGRMQAHMGHWKGMVQTAKAMAELEVDEPLDYRLCIRSMISLAVVSVAVTAGAVLIYKNARR